MVDWTVVDQVGSLGNWFVYSGTNGPVSNLPILAPPGGTYAATTDQLGVGSHVLYQDVTLPANINLYLSFIYYYANYQNIISVPTPPTLNFLPFSTPNQQYRIDITRPNLVDPFSVAPADILANLVQTPNGLTGINVGYTQIVYNLSPFAGQTIRIRFAEVDNVFFFLASVDNVRISCSPPPPLPPPSTPSLTPQGQLQSLGSSVQSNWPSYFQKTQ